jgi:type IV pilus assembly protein PilB
MNNNAFKNAIERELAAGPNISIINLIDMLIKHASKVGASDIHIDPLERIIRIRFRVDGVLESAYELPKTIHSEIISRIKVLSQLRTDEHQATQDGRFRYVFPSEEGNPGRFVDMRVSIVPTYHGENAVLRLLSEKSENLTLENLGFSENDTKKILAAIKKPNGMILSTVPLKPPPNLKIDILPEAENLHCE